MNLKLSFRNLIPQRHTDWFVLPLILAILASTPVLAEERYIGVGQPDGVALLAPPPVPGSAEEAADLATSRLVFKGRTSAEGARAMKDANLSIFNFEPAIGPVFQRGKLPKTEALLEKVKKEISEAINIPKDHWKRLRPYQMDKDLTLGKGEPSASYPSGHSTRGTVQSLILAELFPEKREAILEFGRTIGWDRVLIGKHFITDVRAGRVLGQAIVRELMKNEAFQHDLAEAKAEIKAAQAQMAEVTVPAGVGK